MSINKKSDFEFISIMAGLMALSSLSIDALLPGLNDIALALDISDPKDNQLLITLIFLGLGFGQLISGPLSDSLGRKPVIYIGFSVFIVASFVCIYATNLEMMIAGRLLQGIGLSAPRTVSIAIIRDRFSGDYMAKIMSFVTVIFIIAPVVAPSFGKLLLELFGWQSIFHSQVILGLFVIIWLWRRQPETLKKENKKAVNLSLFTNGIKEFSKYRQTLVFTLFSGLITASFLVYISASQQIFQEQYGLVDEFPFIFSGLALGIGLSTYLNGLLVVRVGMLKMISIATLALMLIASSYVFLFYTTGNPSSNVLIIYLGLLLFPIGFIFGNTGALAMQPIGHIAGVGAAITGFLSTIIAVPISIFIGRYIITTALPLFVGFAICALLCLALLLYYNSTKEIKLEKSALQ